MGTFEWMSPMLVNAQASNIEVSQSALTATPPEAVVRGERTLGALGWDTGVEHLRRIYTLEVP